MTEIDALKYELEQQEKAFNKLHKMYISLLKQQGELEKENEQLKTDIEYYKIERLALFEYIDKKDDLKLELKVE